MQKAEVSSDKEILKHEVGRLAALCFFFISFTVCQKYANTICKLKMINFLFLVNVIILIYIIYNQDGRENF